jgi:hypothetical protein
LFGFRLFPQPVFNTGVHLGLLALALPLREGSVGPGIISLVPPHKFYGGKKFFPPVNHAGASSFS